MNDSSTGGYLLPVSQPQAEDADLDGIIQAVIVGITGLDGAYVRPKWQQIPPAIPDRLVNWCAFGVNVTDADINPTITHNGSDDNGLGASTESRTETLEITTSFYGPYCRSYGALLRDGFGLAQNRDALRAQNMAYVGTERMNLVPDLRGTQFVRHFDFVFRVRRMVSRTYAIRNVVDLAGTLSTSTGTTADL